MRPLTIDERINARQAARQAVIRSAGEQPRREQFQHAGFSRYPRWVVGLVAGAMLIVFIAAALPSLFRLFSAGRDYFMIGIPDATQAAVAGASTFLLAEFLVIVSTLVMRVYFTGRAALLMALPIAFGVFMALVGNWVVAQPHDLFGWLETLAPPVAVLFMSLIGEKIILTAIEQRQQNEAAYQAALAGYKKSTEAPEQSPSWGQMYANALRDALIRKNSRYKTERELLPNLSTEDWRGLVAREMQADSWYVISEVSAAPPVNGKGSEDFLSLPLSVTAN